MGRTSPLNGASSSEKLPFMLMNAIFSLQETRIGRERQLSSLFFIRRITAAYSLGYSAFTAVMCSSSISALFRFGRQKRLVGTLTKVQQQRLSILEQQASDRHDHEQRTAKQAFRLLNMLSDRVRVFRSLL